MSGIFFRSFFDIPRAVYALMVLIGVALCLVGYLVQIRDHAQSRVVLAGIFLLVCVLGGWRMHIDVQQVSSLAAYEGQSVVLDARVVREPEERVSSVHLYVTRDGTSDTEEQILVTIDPFMPRPQYGDIVRVSGTVTPPEPFASDGGRVFDYPGYLRARNVHYRIPYASVAVLTSDQSGFLSLLFSGKQQFMDAFERIVPQPGAGLGEGLLLGVRRAIGEDLERAFRETGLIHIVVLSGYNIMIVVEAMGYVLAAWFRPRVRMVCGVLGIVTFVLLVGASATAIRAGIMAGLVLLARATGRTYVVLRALMLAAVCMLLENPFLLGHDPGFQLSFLATLGLILLPPHIERYCMRVPEHVGLRSIVVATIATQLFVLPLLLYHTGLLSLISVAANVLVLPVVPFAMLGTFLTGMIAVYAPLLAYPFGLITHVLLTYIIEVARISATLPFASVSVSAFPFWWVPLGYLGILWWIQRAGTAHADGLSDNLLSEWVIETHTEKPERDVRSGLL